MKWEFNNLSQEIMWESPQTSHMLSKVYKEEWACWCKWLNITSNVDFSQRNQSLSISPKQICDILFFCERGMPHVNLQAQLPLRPPLTWQNCLCIVHSFFPSGSMQQCLGDALGQEHRGFVAAKAGGGRKRQQEWTGAGTWEKGGSSWLLHRCACMCVSERERTLIWSDNLRFASHLIVPHPSHARSCGAGLSGREWGGTGGNLNQ